jgi:hypothetical protein
MSRRPASPHGCSVHSAGLGLRTRPLGGRRRLPAIADSPSGIGEPGGARAPRARAPYPRGRSFRANICDFLAPAPPHAIPRLRGLPSTKLLLQQDALHDRPGTAGAAPPGCVSTRRRPLRGGPSTHHLSHTRPAQHHFGERCRAQAPVGSVDKHASNPILKEEKMWELRFGNTQPSIWVDPADGKYKLCYNMISTCEQPHRQDGAADNRCARATRHQSRLRGRSGPHTGRLDRVKGQVDRDSSAVEGWARPIAVYA